MLSFSCCWNSARHTEGGGMLREIHELGFANVELSHGVRVSLIGGVQRAVEAGLVRISSLHNFCPLPLEVQGASPDCYEFTSHRPHDQQRAFKLSCQTIDFAQRLGAAFVVLHMGRVPMGGVTRQLGQLAKEGKIFSREFVQLKVAAVQEREKKAPLYFRRAKETLLRLADHAATRGVHLGVESRFGYEELPTEREMVTLLDEVNAPHVGYWHDFGHMQVKHNLGFLDHYEWLRSIRHRLFGCHLHDCQWPTTDHRVPFQGGIEYDRLIPLLPENTLLVWELSPRMKAEDIRAARLRWQERFPATVGVAQPAAAAPVATAAA